MLNNALHEKLFVINCISPFGNPRDKPGVWLKKCKIVGSVKETNNVSLLGKQQVAPDN